jgi:hypothetical protein
MGLEVIRFKFQLCHFWRYNLEKVFNVFQVCLYNERLTYLHEDINVEWDK